MHAPSAKSWDVLVVGGGSAGFSAAVSAARAGAKTLLLEQSDVLGGNATQALVHTLCGLFLPPHPGSTSASLEYANPGFAERFALWLLKNGAAQPPEIHGKVGVLPTSPENMAQVMALHGETIPHLTIALETKITRFERPHDEGFAFQLSCDRESRFEAKILIDTSGDAAAASGCEALTDTPSAEEVQLPTYIFRVSRANPSDLKGYNRLKLNLAFTRAEQSGRLPAGASSVFFRPRTLSGEAYVSLNMPKPPDGMYDPLNEASVKAISLVAQSWAEQIVHFARETFPGWSGCEIIDWPRRIGIREARRVLGRHIMTGEEILSGILRSDEVAKSTWPIELWHQHTGAGFSYPAGPCSIPLGALISASNPCLGMAGRCMSGTHEALGAMRVIGTALATGEAIGLAAALALNQKSTLASVSSTQVQTLRSTIHREAGELP